MRKNYKLLLNASTLHMHYKQLVNNAIKNKRLKLFLILKLLAILKSKDFQEYIKNQELEYLKDCNEDFELEKYGIPYDITDKEIRKIMRLKAKHYIKEKKKNGGIEMEPKNKEINNLFRQAVGINTNEENINDNNKDNNIENQTNNVKNKNKNTRNSNKFIKENTKNTKNSNKFTKTSNKFMNDQIKGAAKKNDGLLEHLKRNKDIENAFKGGGNND